MSFEGHVVAPVDLSSVHATVRVTSSGLQIEATAEFRASAESAQSVLELGPVPSEALLDGVAAFPTRLTVGDPPREVVSLGTLPPCSEHTLAVRYTLPAEWMFDEGGPARFEATADGVFWAAGMTDDEPGRFLSMWLPSNLLFDRFHVSMHMDVSGLGTPHELAATGQVREVDAGWEISWEGIQAHAPFWVLSPVAVTEQRRATVPLAEGDVVVEVRSLSTDPGADPDDALDRAVAAVADNAARFGPYSHGDVFWLWIREDRPHSMEYDGATLTQMHNVEHEVLHSWFGRGAAPVADLHGWVDEAFTSWATDFFPYREAELDLSSEPRPLQVGTNEWAGAMLGPAAYFHGSAVPADIAYRHGVDALVEALAAFYEDRVGRSYRAADLEEHLTCWFDDDGVREAFRHTGYGLEGPIEARAESWCR